MRTVIDRRLIIRGCVYAVIFGAVLCWRGSRAPDVASIGFGGYEVVDEHLCARIFITNRTSVYIRMPWSWLFEHGTPSGVRVAGGKAQDEKDLWNWDPPYPSRRCIAPGCVESILVAPPIGRYRWRILATLICASRRERSPLFNDYFPAPFERRPLSATRERLRWFVHGHLPFRARVRFERYLDGRPVQKFQVVSSWVEAHPLLNEGQQGELFAEIEKRFILPERNPE